MSSNSSHNPLSLKDKHLICAKNDHGHPYIICKGLRKATTHTSLRTLLCEIPELAKKDQLLNLAKIANFLFKGEEFELIEDPEAFKKAYREQIEREQESFEMPVSPLMSYGIFDVDEVRPPFIARSGKGDMLVFYVAKKIPYKVTCEYPPESEDAEVKYEMLESYS